MYRINPRLKGFKCIFKGTELPIGDYFEGCEDSFSGGYPANVKAVYDFDGAWQGRLSGRGLMRYKDFLPYIEFSTLGEGGTSIVESPALAENLGLAKVWVKNEGQNPTGSHKDRLSPLVVARAADLGKTTVAAASSGNGGVSMAAYAAAAGLKCAVITTDAIAPYWKRALKMLDAEIILTSDSNERWRILKDKVRKGEWYPGTNYTSPPVGSNPFGLQGYKTIAYEIVEDLDDELPDAIMVPVSRGDLLWGIWEGFRELKEFGRIEKYPRLFAVEPFPRLTRVLEGSDYRGTFSGSTRLISIGGNTVTYQMVYAVEQTRGGAVVVKDSEAEEDVHRLGRFGFYSEGSSAVCYSALSKLREQGQLEAVNTAVMILTSQGFKDGFRAG